MDAQNNQWVEWFGGGFILFLTGAVQAWKYLSEKNKDARPSHVVLEQADLADIEPLRALAARVPTLVINMEGIKSDLASVRSDVSAVRTLVEKIDRNDEVAREVARELRNFKERSPRT